MRMPGFMWNILQLSFTLTASPGDMLSPLFSFKEGKALGVHLRACSLTQLSDSLRPHEL